MEKRTKIKKQVPKSGKKLETIVKKIVAKDNSIDDIFNVVGSKRKVAEVLPTEITDQSKKKKEAKVKKSISMSGKSTAKEPQEPKIVSANSFSKHANAKPVRYDAALGMNIYSEESLNMEKGGYTKDCPFDCDCCF